MVLLHNMWLAEQTMGEAEQTAEGTSRDAVLAPVLDALSNFRNAVRVRGRELKDQQLLGITDALRDEVMLYVVQIIIKPSTCPS